MPMCVCVLYVCITTQVAEEHLSAGDGDCETFATVSGQNFCSVADLQAAVKTAR